MTQPFDPMLRIDTLRADHFPHIENPDNEGSIESLGTDYLNVDTDAHPGRVTLAAGSAHDPWDGQGVEFDLEPAAARQLGEQLARAAETLGGPRESVRPSPRRLPGRS